MLGAKITCSVCGMLPCGWPCSSSRATTRMPVGDEGEVENARVLLVWV